VCPQANAKRITHREARPRPQAPYEVVAFDLIEMEGQNSRR
jgi:hypothetical protein